MAQTLTAQSGQTVLLATFFVRGALCALDATEVQEVIRLGPVTPVRYAPEAVVGIVNLRGKIVTIVDLGLRLGLPKAVAGSDSRIFIMEDRGEFIGLLVDQVDEVVEIERERLAAAASQRELGAGSVLQGRVPRSRPGNHAGGCQPDSGGSLRAR